MKHDLYNTDGTPDHEMLNLLARAGHKASNESEMERALELSSAGWTPETPNHTPHPFTGSVDVMSWYWRRPSRRAGKPGRLFLSTGQAYSAMKREV